MTNKIKTETVLITVAYKIRYGCESGRNNALEKLEGLPLEVGGVGLNGVYRATRGKVVSVVPIAKEDL
jgi:hypothetical protein